MEDSREWLLTKVQRSNPATRIDDAHPEAWSEGNQVRPLVDGAAYFAELYERLSNVGAGDLVLFTDWQGSPDERLTGEPGSEIVDVLRAASERGADVRGLIWRSHWDKLGFFAEQNLSLGEQLQEDGAEVLLDMRVRTGGAHHQKFLVIRHGSDSSRDVAYVGGIDLAHTRRDDHRHHGDPQAEEMTEEYGATPAWHDVQLAIQGPAVHDVETVFRERWDDPMPLSRHPYRRLQDRWRGLDTTPKPLPRQHPPPQASGPFCVQMLRTYPNLRHGRGYAFARSGERSVARGYTKAIARARELIYVEDQYLWGHDIARAFRPALERNPGLHLVAVLPLETDLDGTFSRIPQLLGRERAIRDLIEMAPDRVAIYGLENDLGFPIYVHAKVCIIDDTWMTVGSDNFNQRSWTHDSELSAAVVQPPGASALARDLRLRLAAEHLGRLGPEGESPAMDDCTTGADLFRAYAHSAERLDAWHQAGRQGPRPAGRLRALDVPSVPRWQRSWATLALDLVHDPDGRPRRLRQRDAY